MTGANAAPPDDVGGVGYAEFVEAITDPRHPEHQAMLDWFGSTFDPAAFDIAEVDRQLKDQLSDRQHGLRRTLTNSTQAVQSLTLEAPPFNYE